MRGEQARFECRIVLFMASGERAINYFGKINITLEGIGSYSAYYP